MPRDIYTGGRTTGTYGYNPFNSSSGEIQVVIPLTQDSVEQMILNIAKELTLFSKDNSISSVICDSSSLYIDGVRK